MRGFTDKLHKKIPKAGRSAAGEKPSSTRGIMRRNRACWCGIILAALLLYFFDNETATLAVLDCAAGIPILSGLSLLMIKIPPEIAFQSGAGDGAPGSSRPDDGAPGSALPDGTCSLSVINPNFLPIAQLMIRVRARNLRTASEEDREVVLTVPGHKKVSAAACRMEHTGRYELDAEHVCCMDPLGLFIRTFPAVQQHAQETRYPELFPLQLAVRSSAAVFLESDLYMDHRGGNDPGEVHSIREYVPGDPIRNMHWKLSEKTDKMLVKELGKPVTDQLLVLLDTADPGGMTEDGSDAVAAVYGSVLQTLLGMEMDFSAGWPGNRGGTVVRKITSEAALSDAAREWLASGPDAPDVLEGLDMGHDENRFEHLVIIGPEIPAGLHHVSGGALVTVLVYGQSPVGSFPAVDTVIGFDEHSMKTQLQGLEI